MRHHSTASPRGRGPSAFPPVRGLPLAHADPDVLAVAVAFAVVTPLVAALVTVQIETPATAALRLKIARPGAACVNDAVVNYFALEAPIGGVKTRARTAGAADGPAYALPSLNRDQRCVSPS